MADHRHGDCRPIQTSAVIVLGACQSRGPAIPPPSPPTPCFSPDDALCDPSDSFNLGGEYSERERIKDSRIRSGIHVLDTEAVALSNLTRLYETDPVARDGFNQAIQAIVRQKTTAGKLVITGVGKSGHIGKKLVATFQSLAVRAVFLHPTEALHGDLGLVGPDDTLMFITYSGKTKELLLMLPHLDEKLPTILLTSHTRHETCEFLQYRPNTILLPAPIPEPETKSFGVAAPSTSTTAALALGDALALTAAHELHPSVSAAFAKNHPGGAIGAAVRQPQTLGEVCVPWVDIPAGQDLCEDSLCFDLLRAGYDSKTGWVKVQNAVASPSKIRELSREDLGRPLRDVSGVLRCRYDMMTMSSDTTLRQAGDLIRNLQSGGEETFCGPDCIIAVMEDGNMTGVIEVGQALGYES